MAANYLFSSEWARSAGHTGKAAAALVKNRTLGFWLYGHMCGVVKSIEAVEKPNYQENLRRNLLNHFGAIFAFLGFFQLQRQSSGARRR